MPNEHHVAHIFAFYYTGYKTHKTRHSWFLNKLAQYTYYLEGEPNRDELEAAVQRHIKPNNKPRQRISNNENPNGLAIALRAI